MSNVMSLKNIRNNVHRNSFDLSCRNAFTAKVGELLPVFTKEVIPGDKFKLRVESFTRTQPVNTAAYTRIKEYYDWFFVPNRLLWRYFPQFVTQTSSKNPQFAGGINSALSVNVVPPLMSSLSIENYLNALIGISNEQSDLSGSAANMFGYWRAPLTCKLLSYLGYGDFNPVTFELSDGKTYKDYLNWSSIVHRKNVFLSPFPLLAYQKIYQDYFRDSQWQNASPQTYNVDYLGNESSGSGIVPVSEFVSQIQKKTFSPTPNMFDLQYANWNKDLLMGALPNSQFGDVASVDIDTVVNGSTSPVDGAKGYGDVGASQLGMTNQAVLQTTKGLTNFFSNPGFTNFSLGVGISSDINKSINSLKTTSSFSVLALRQAEALQKWKEITQSNKLDYKHQVESHFGISVSDTLSNLCSWIGGTSSSITINEVLNTNLADINSNVDNGAYIAGKGIGLVNSSDEFVAHEHGILMCIYHATPLLDYDINGLDPLVLKTSIDRYAIPELDSIGNEVLPSLYFDCSDDSDSLSKFDFLGYVPRYVDYKTSIDKVNGAFKDSLSYWVAPLRSSYLYVNGNLHALDWRFFKVNPSVLDSIFAVDASSDVNTDNLLVNAFFDVKAVRNLDYNGLPY